MDSSYKPRRVTEVLRGDKWVKVSCLGQVAKGDVFRMTELTGEPVLEAGSSGIMIAMDCPFLADNGRWTIECKEHVLDK
ncbi:hypothetical protein SOV_04670 [Sporomusa ovata DSM 2662]|nr:hypothetical protein [Sporomusa ovata]EQB28137.1 hypothetical protein SOV_2c10600 [Sporomusa ovata DSM 2662]